MWLASVERYYTVNVERYCTVIFFKYNKNSRVNELYIYNTGMTLWWIIFLGNERSGNVEDFFYLFSLKGRNVISLKDCAWSVQMQCACSVNKPSWHSTDVVLSTTVHRIWSKTINILAPLWAYVYGRVLHYRHGS